MAAKKKTARRANSKLEGDSRKVAQGPIAESARPSASEDGRRSRRRQKSSVGGYRDILTIKPKDESFHNEYVARWVKDSDERGHKILYYYENDWDFVKAEEVTVGENFVYKGKGPDAIVRAPAGTSTEDAKKWVFLMKKYRDWHEDDQLAKQADIRKTEEYIDRKRDPEKREVEGEGHETEGLYGGSKTKWESAV